MIFEKLEVLFFDRQMNFLFSFWYFILFPFVVIDKKSSDDIRDREQNKLTEVVFHCLSFEKQICIVRVNLKWFYWANRQSVNHL